MADADELLFAPERGRRGTAAGGTAGWDAAMKKAAKVGLAFKCLGRKRGTGGTTVLTQGQFAHNGFRRETQAHQSNSGAVVTGSTGSPLGNVGGPGPAPSVTWTCQVR